MGEAPRRPRKKYSKWLYLSLSQGICCDARVGLRGNKEEKYTGALNWKLEKTPQNTENSSENKRANHGKNQTRVLARDPLWIYSERSRLFGKESCMQGKEN